MISVIIPAYNVKEYLLGCVASVSAQAATGDEIILVDDGSTDGTAVLCEEIAAGDERINVVHKANGGLSSARNAGIDVARGEYLLFLDGDDSLTPDALATLRQAVASNPEADFIQFLYLETDGAKPFSSSTEATSEIETVTDRHEMFARLITRGGVYASACTKLIKRHIFSDIRFTEGLKHEDEDFTTRLLASCRSVAYLERVLYLYYMRQGSLIKSSFGRRDLDALTVRKWRIEVLQQLGYEDLAEQVTAQLFSNCCILYDRARAAGDKEACRQLTAEATAAASRRPPLSGQSALTATALRYGLTPILPIMHSLRVLKHKLCRN